MRSTWIGLAVLVLIIFVLYRLPDDEIDLAEYQEPPAFVSESTVGTEVEVWRPGKPNWTMGGPGAAALSLIEFLAWHEKYKSVILSGFSEIYLAFYGGADRGQCHARFFVVDDLIEVEFVCEELEEFVPSGPMIPMR